MGTIVSIQSYRSSKDALQRRMSRILTLMSAGQASQNKMDCMLVADGERWYVGPIPVNPAAARQLISLGLVVECSVLRSRRYRLASLVRSRTAELDELVARREYHWRVASLCSVVVQEAVTRDRLSKLRGSTRFRDLIQERTLF